MGGNGIAYLAFANPDLFAAISPMSGYYSTWWVRRLKKIPTWFFHGDADSTVPVFEADRMVEEFKREGVTPKYT
jgi:predicted peptidase